MANTYSQIYIHIVLVVKNRESLIVKRHQPEIFRYMSGIITNKGHKSIIVNGMPDHVHILIGLNPAFAISDIVREVKKSTSSFINNKGYLKGKFYWQQGYGAFSYSRSQLDKVYNYILNQERHHMKSDFKTEYLNLLNEFQIDYNSDYLFNFDIQKK